MSEPRITNRELVSALLELHEQVRELSTEVAALRFAVIEQLRGRVVDRIDDRGFAVASPRST